MTPLSLLRRARELGLARLDAMALISHRLGTSREWLIAHDDSPIDPQLIEPLLDDFRRRAGGEPLAYLLGSKDFHSLPLYVTPAVLVPRPDTELLVDWALQLLREEPITASWPEPVVVDLGTGSGAVALAIKHGMPRAQLHGVDCSDGALAVAVANGLRLGLSVRWHLGHWWRGEWLEALARPIQLVVSNPPYIAEGDPHLPALSHEPSLALVSGRDGLDALREIIAGAARQLSPGGWLLLEHGHDQGQAVREWMVRHHFATVQTRQDLGGLDRCTGGQWPGPRHS